MSKLEFPPLTAKDVEVRIQAVWSSGCRVLLYKDARADQNMLDSVVGAMNWQRHHSRENANCIVSIYDENKKQWIEKEDTGTESFTEAQKGLASDSFKRACFNWGIGRELYTAPKDIKIWYNNGAGYDKQNKKDTPADDFIVSKMNVNDKKQIIELEIQNARTGAVVYSFLADTDNKKKESPVVEKPKQDKNADTDRYKQQVNNAPKQKTKPKWSCDGCGAGITEALHDNTVEATGKAMCRSCAAEYKTEQAQGGDLEF